MVEVCVLGISVMKNLFSKQTKQNKLFKKESKLMVARGKGGGEIGEGD